MNLIVKIQFLDRFYHGQKENDFEYPPSPKRVFDAITNAAAQITKSTTTSDELSDKDIKTLEWLELLDIDRIIAPPGTKGIPYRIFVPDNNLDVSAKSWSKGKEPPPGERPEVLRSAKWVYPIILTDKEVPDPIYYVWRLPTVLSQEEEKYIENLVNISKTIHHVGWGIDLVSADVILLTQEETTKLTGNHWIAQ